MNDLMPPRLNSLNSKHAEKVRENAFYYFLLEEGDSIEEDWGEAFAQQMLQEFAEKMPVLPSWWIDRSLPCGMPNRPGKAIESMKYNWQRFDAVKKAKLAEDLIEISIR